MNLYTGVCEGCKSRAVQCLQVGTGENTYCRRCVQAALQMAGDGDPRGSCFRSGVLAGFAVGFVLAAAVSALALLNFG